MTRLEIFDTTLRDGAQAEGISFSVSDRLAIVRELDDFGIGYIEAGNPGSNPKEMAFFEKAGDLALKQAKLVAFGSTRRKNVETCDDENVKALLRAQTPAVAIFGKAWDLHVREILHTTLPDNLLLVEDTVRFFVERGREVIFDAEHFYDGYADNPGYALEVLRAAARGGARVLCLCDTDGGVLPQAMGDVTSWVCREFTDVPVGVHCHNDIGCAVANTLIGVTAGARHVQGTFIGIGERCGNADLSVILPSLQLKMGYECIPGGLTGLYHTARTLAELSNLSLPGDRPYVGGSAFAHKGGMHIDGVSKLTRSFEHVDPALVGNKRRFLLSEVSGKGAVLLKVEALAPHLDKNSPETALILDQIKTLESQGYQFEAADASFALLVQRLLKQHTPHFKTVMYKTNGEFPPPDGFTSASAMIQIEVGGRTETTASLGNGPVNALDLALRKALCVFYPALQSVVLVDYKVRVLDSAATGSQVRVLIRSTDGETEWTTVGASTDIIQASFAALVDSIEYKLSMEEE